MSVFGMSSLIQFFHGVFNMNISHKKSLALVIATALGSISPLSHALVDLTGDDTDRDPVLFALEESGESSIKLFNAVPAAATSEILGSEVGDLAVRFPIVPGYTVDDANNKTMFIEVTLTGGAKFAKNPVLLCADHSTDDTTDVWNGTDGLTAFDVAGGAWTVAGSNIASAADALADIQAAQVYLLKTESATVVGAATASFNFTKGFTAAVNNDGCLLTFTADIGASHTDAFVTAITIGTRQDIGMKVNVGYKEANVEMGKTFSGTIIKFVTAWKAETKNTSVNGTDPTSTVTIDVAAGSKKFLNGATMANVGTVLVNSANDITLIRLSDNTADGGDSVKALVTALSVQVSGATVAGASEVSLNDAATCAGNKVAGATPTTTSGSGPTVTLGLTAGNISTLYQPGFNVCLKVAGTTVLQDGQLSASFAGSSSDGSYVLDLGSGGDIKKVGVNGVKIRVLNIPNPTNADQAYIRFYNTGTTGTVVTGSLYGQDGKAIGVENIELFNPLKANDVEVLSAAQLASLFGGGTPVSWTGRAWLLVQAQISTELFKVQGLVRSPSGVLVNLSTDASN
jgi:hypothetical protein